MTQDFAKRPRRPAAKRKPAAPKRAKTNPPKNQVPGWVWLFTGTVLGAFIMFLAYLSGIAGPPPEPTTASATQKPAPKSETPKPRFDFYQLLKETEVAVKDPPIETDSKNKAADEQEFILQVGSFKKSADADRLRAELILMNLEAQVETVTVRNGETWHRVLVGPYLSRSKVAAARSTLVSNDINPLLLKRKRS